MDAVIFDIDGTLTRTTQVDDESLAAAFGRFLGVEMPRVDWHEFGVSTDEALLVEACRRVRGRPPDADEVVRAKGMFVEALRERIEADRGRCLAVEGAREVIGGLLRTGRWRVGLASGAWRESARLKLEYAGVPTHGVPATFSHAHPDARPAEREEIVAGTIAALGGAGAARVIYVGDGVWDARAAKRLGIGFVGLRHDGDESRLRSEGACEILRGFGDLGAVEAALRRAGEGMGTGAGR